MILSVVVHNILPSAKDNGGQVSLLAWHKSSDVESLRNEDLSKIRINILHCRELLML
ncbi:hypothetical protein Mal35_18640 [Gimesia maris]|nr:hypothetical protein Mal35_18640 [Gimesia maris]